MTSTTNKDRSSNNVVKTRKTFRWNNKKKQKKKEEEKEEEKSILFCQKEKRK